MKRQILHGKIHGATVTEAKVEYEGSITIDQNLLRAANILPHEKVLIANLTNGARLESYAIEGPAGSGAVCLNGGAAKHGKAGDKVIIMAFAAMTAEEARVFEPRVIHVGSNNRIMVEKRGQAAFF